MTIYPLGDYWGNQEEKSEVADRILKLNDDQIWKLFEKVGITWSASQEEIIEEIREKKRESFNNCLSIKNEAKFE